MGLFSSSFKSFSDEHLMQLLTQGKRKAFDELYHRYAKKMHFFFFKMLNGDRDKADDFVQDLFLKVFEKPHLFRIEMRFSTWLYSIAGNSCKNEYRRLSIRNETHQEMDLDPYYFENESSIATMDLSNFKESLEAALQQFSPENRMILHLRFTENMPIQEIGLVMNCPEGTIKSRLFYMIKKLYQMLHEHNPYI